MSFSYPPRYAYKRDGSTYRSFLSYSTRDDEVRVIKPLVDRYIDRIRDSVEYIPVYYDYFYARNGSRDLCGELGRAIRTSDFTTAFLSPGYDSSPWCGFEWGYTHALNNVEGDPGGFALHPLLAIVWKRPITNFEAQGGRFWGLESIDISKEIAAGAVEEALDIALHVTFHFLDRLRNRAW